MAGRGIILLTTCAVLLGLGCGFDPGQVEPGADAGSFDASEPDAGSEADAGPADASSDPCDGVDCSGLGTCADDAGAPLCVCEAGYVAEGLACVAETPVEPTWPAPDLRSVEVVDGAFVLTWILPATDAGLPEGGYDLVIDGVDTNDHLLPTALTAVVPGLTKGAAHCFMVEARWTQAVPPVFPRSEELCATDDSEPDPPPVTGGYLDLLQQAEGFARPTGGAAGPRLVVTSLSDTGAGTLRAALAHSGPKWISFQEGLSGTIVAGSWLNIPSDTTVDGRGADITITGNGLMISGKGTRNIILHNLKIESTSNDAIRVINGAGDIWIDHCSFQAWGDGAVDITNGVEGHQTNVTVSWCHFFQGGKTSLISGTSNPAANNADWNIYVTFHHNFFDRVRERTPRTRFAKVHVYNNYLYESGYCGASTLAELIVDHNIFETSTTRYATYANCIGSDCDFNDAWGLSGTDGGALRATGNWLDAGTATARQPTARESLVFAEFAVGLPPYAFTSAPADSALRTAVRAGAGWRDVPLPGN